MATFAGEMFFYDSFLLALTDGTIDLDTDTLKVALFTNSYTPSASGDTAYSGLSGEVANGNGYTTAGLALSGVSLTQTSGALKFDATDPVWTASGGSITARRYVLYSVTASGNDLICYGLLNYNDADVTTTDGNTLTLALASAGLITATSTSN